MKYEVKATSMRLVIFDIDGTLVFGMLGCVATLAFRLLELARMAVPRGCFSQWLLKREL